MHMAACLLLLGRVRSGCNLERSWNPELPARQQTRIDARSGIVTTQKELRAPGEVKQTWKQPGGHHLRRGVCVYAVILISGRVTNTGSGTVADTQYYYIRGE